MVLPTYEYETEKHRQGFCNIAGCDEVGIGPLAGPVVAAAVVLNPTDFLPGNINWWRRVRDSKKVPEKERLILANVIKEHALAFSVAIVSHETIDQINILNAAMEAMKQSLNNLAVKIDYVFVDGKHKIRNFDSIEQEPVIGGDSKIISIACASILAKVSRDALLDELHTKYPPYNFKSNKGYPTKAHREALMKYGPSPVHRESFGLVKQLITGQKYITNFKSS